MTASKAKLSRTADLIVDRYRQEIKGGERFLSYELRFAMLTAATYYLMTVREDVESTKNTVKHFTEATREAATYLFPEEWTND